MPVKAPIWIRLCQQTSNAPVIDGGMTVRRRGEDSWGYDGIVVLLAPWRRDAHGERLHGRALFVGVLRRRGGVGAARWLYRPRPRGWLAARRGWW